jgi:hypothetical protein
VAEEEEGAKLFNGFPCPFTDDRLADFQRLLKHAQNGDIEIYQMEVQFTYYAVDAAEENGWRLATGVTRMRPVGAITRPDTVAEPEIVVKKTRRRK